MSRSSEWWREARREGRKLLEVEDARSFLDFPTLPRLHALMMLASIVFAIGVIYLTSSLGALVFMHDHTHAVGLLARWVETRWLVCQCGLFCVEMKR